MPLGLLGKKLGMTQLFDEKGTAIPVTVIQAGPCKVIQKRTMDSDGYNAVQIGFDPKPERKVNKPMAGHFAKAGVEAVRLVRELRGDETQELEIGGELNVSMFEEGERVDVSGQSKGRGFTGTIKRHNTSPGPKTHGSMFHRRPGSNGGSSYPSRVFKGKKGPGQHGNERVTIKKLRIVKCDTERNLILVRGSIPGANGSYVVIRKGRGK